MTKCAKYNTMLWAVTIELELVWHSVTKCTKATVPQPTCRSSWRYKWSLCLHIWVLSNVPWVFPWLWGAIWSIESDICIGNTDLPYTPPAIVPQLILMVGSLKYYFLDIQSNYLIVSWRVRKVFCGYGIKWSWSCTQIYLLTRYQV